MQSKALRHVSPLVVLATLISPLMVFAQTGLSHVRVVRLSYVSGTVALKRPGSTEWAKAQVNTPIQEGFEISTSANSYAEVEFENGSTARLGEASQVKFDQLAIDADGNKFNHLTFEQGYATFHFLPEHADSYSVKIADATLTPNGKSSVFRADLGSHQLRLEVFSGSIQVATGAQSVKLGKDKVLEFDPQATEVALNTTQGIVKDSWDKWTSERDGQTELSMNTRQGQGPAYGWSDLDTYGEWGYFPGFGYGWSPFAMAGWSPYSMGMWSMYPGMGYTWIGAEPWGWLPYHYGSWGFAPDFGWFWMPGSMGAWSPSLVSWYSGPGWVGWSPRGVSSVRGQRIVNSVPTATVQNGQFISPKDVINLPASAGHAVANLSLEPGAGALLPGQRLAAGGQTASAPHSSFTRTTAPSVLMGGNAEQEQSLHGGIFSRGALRARMGPTLGGHYQVGGTVGEFRGDAFSGRGGSRVPPEMNGPQGSARGSGSMAPTLASRGGPSAGAPHSGGGGMAAGGGGHSMGGGSQSMGPSMGSSGGGHSSGGGGHSGGPH